MKLTSKLIVVLLVICLGALCFVACNAKNETPSTPTSTTVDTVVIGTTAVIEKAVRGEYNYEMLSSGNSDIPLVYKDTDGAYHPLLASYTTTDSKTWTFTVVDGMKWSDGVDVTAEDILFTLQQEDKVGEGKTYTSAVVSSDKKSIALTLPSVNLRALADLTYFRTMPKHIYEGKTEEQITEADGRVVCGPYVLESFNKDAGTLTFVQNTYYPNKPNVNKIVFQLFDQADVMYLALAAGDLDSVWAYSVGVPQTYASILKDAKDIVLETAPQENAPAVLMFDNHSAPFNNADLRNAISYALDYSKFVEVFGGATASIPNRGFAPNATFGFKETEKLGQNLTKADELMQRAGYAKNSDGKYAKDGAVFEFDLSVTATNAQHVRYAELVKTQLEAFGIKVNIDSLDVLSFRIKTTNKFSGDNDKTVAYQAAINGFTAAGMGMINGFGSIYVDKNHAVQGCCQVDNEEFNGILAEMAAADTPEKYFAGSAKLQDYYATATPLLALYWDAVGYAHTANLEGWVIDATFGINNVNTWMNLKTK